MILAMAANAQEPTGSRPLDIPSPDSLVCRQVPPSARDSLVASSFEFQIGRGPLGGVRSITVMYDNRGALVQLIESNLSSVPGKSVALETVIVRFLPDGATKGTRVRQENQQSAPPVPTDLSSKDVEKARRLGAWLWDHRC